MIGMNMSRICCAVGVLGVWAISSQPLAAQTYVPYGPVIGPQPVYLVQPAPVYAVPTVVAPAPIVQSSYYAPPMGPSPVVAPTYYRVRANYGLFGQWNERVTTVGPCGGSFQHTRVGWNGVLVRGRSW